MRVLVTGDRGYIGHVLAPMLRRRGHEVAGVDAGLFDACALGDEPLSDSVRSDVRQLGSDALRGFDAVVHLAGLCNDPLGDFDPALTDAVNHRAAVRLATLARDAGVRRFLFASSCSVYGAAGDDLIDEESPIAPLTPYARSKADAEDGIRALADDDFSPVFLRAATAYGVSARIRFDLVLNNFVAWALTTGRVRLKSDGAAWRPLVHIEDIAESYVQLLEADRSTVHTQAFNIGRTDQNYRIVDLARVVCESIPGSKLEFADDADRDQRSYRVHCDKLPRALPTYAPRWDVLRGIAEVAAACRLFSLRAGSFEQGRFNRLEHLRALIDDGKLNAQLHWRSQTESVGSVA